MPSRPRCHSRLSIEDSSVRCALPSRHESRHQNGGLTWDHHLIPNGTIQLTIRAETP